MNTIKTFFVIAAMAVLSASAFAEVALNTVAEVEKTAVDEQGNETVSYRPADLVVPGDVVRYTISASNTGAEAADKIVITNPVPAEMQYIAGSAQSSAIGSGTTIEFSVDGGNAWGTLESLVVTEADDTKRPAAAADVNAVRWKLNFSLQAGDAAKVSYKARLK